MEAYKDLTKSELLALKEALDEEYKEAQAKGLSLNMSRGERGASQLELSLPMLDVINSTSDMKTVLGNDTRNYGDLDGGDKKLVVYEEHINEPFPNGESLEDVRSRVKSFFNDLNRVSLLASVNATV